MTYARLGLEGLLHIGLQIQAPSYTYLANKYSLDLPYYHLSSKFPE